MKRNLQILLTVTTASILTFTALAQDANTPKSVPPVLAPDPVPRPTIAQLRSAAKASDVIGMTVQNYQGEKLGTVEDFAIDVESGRIVQVILSTGAYIGVTDRLAAVPPGALLHDRTNKVLRLDANKEKLQGAPEFTTEKWSEFSDSEHLSAVYTYYDQEPAFIFIHNGSPADAHSSRDGSASWDMQLKSRGKWLIPASRLGQVQKASKVIGLPVKNKQDENLGNVDNMQVDVQSGRIVAVVVSSGGFLGMGGELSAVPPTALSFNEGRDALQLDTSKDLLSAAPHFKSDQWPDFNQPAYSDSVYRAYKVEPYFTANTITDEDNTPRNERKLTPIDQGNSKADTDTTAQIRKGILAGKEMSLNARNVKVITQNGRVTLRGPVNSAEEKRQIGEIANRIARSENVDNQLEVTLSTTSN